MHAIKRTSRRGAPPVYFVCSNWRVNHACENSMSAHVTDIDAAVVSALREHVSTSDVLEDVIARAVELHLSEPNAQAERLQRLTSERQRLREELSRYAEAIARAAPCRRSWSRSGRVSNASPRSTLSSSISTGWPRQPSRGVTE